MPLDPTIPLKVLTPTEATAASQQNAIRAEQLRNAPIQRQANEETLKRSKIETRAAELDGALKETETAFGLLSTARDENSYQAMRQKAQSLGVEISDIPPMFDPNFVRQATMLTLDAKERLSQERQAIKAEFDNQLTQARIGTENAQAGSFNALGTQRMAAADLNRANAEKARMVPVPTAPTSVQGTTEVLPPPTLGGDGMLQPPPMVEGASPPPLPTPVQTPRFDFGTVPSVTSGIETEGQRALATRKAMEDAQKAIDAQTEVVNAENKTRAAMAEFETAMKRQGGSPNVAQNIPLVAMAQRALDPDVATMARVQAEVAPNMRPPGSGATSDYDAKQFERATVGADKPTEANQRIIVARTQAAEDAQAKLQFMESFRQQHGHLRGSEGAWQKYLNANPIFDRRKQDFSLNPSRKTWDEFFGGKKTDKADPLGIRG